MKLNYREKIILGVFLAVAIMFGIFIGLVKPKTKTLKANETKRDELIDQRDEIQRKIDQIPVLKEKINNIYEETVKISEIFVPMADIDTSIELDKALQKYADENNVKIVSLNAGKPSVATLGYYYSKDEDFAKELRKEADLNDALLNEYNENHAEEIALSERKAESLIQTKYGIRVVGTKEDIWNYLKAIEDIDKAVVINQVNIADYTFGKEAMEKAQQAGAQIVEAAAPEEQEAPAEGEAAEEAEKPEEKPEEEQEAAPQKPVSVITADGEEISNVSNVDIVISLYSVYNMPKPDTDYIPDATE